MLSIGRLRKRSRSARSPKCRFSIPSQPTGETFLVEMPGGGGYGDPKKRPAEEVLEDVLNGYVSIETAERDYGVAINPDTMALDKARTAALRGR